MHDHVSLRHPDEHGLPAPAGHGQDLVDGLLEADHLEGHAAQIEGNVKAWASRAR